MGSRAITRYFYQIISAKYLQNIFPKYREICRPDISRAEDWADLEGTMDPEHIKQLKSIYRHVDDIDLYVGGFLEAAHEDSILGPVFKCIIGDQFARLKKGDRFFYDLGLDENIAFSLAQLNEVKLNRK